MVVLQSYYVPKEEMILLLVRLDVADEVVEITNSTKNNKLYQTVQ